MKTAKRDFIIHDFSVGLLADIKWFIIEGDNEDDINNGKYLDKNGNLRIYGISNIHSSECQFNSRREAIGFLKSKFKNVNIVKEIQPARYIEHDWEDDDYDEGVDWDDDDDEDDYDDDF